MSETNNIIDIYTSPRCFPIFSNFAMSPYALHTNISMFKQCPTPHYLQLPRCKMQYIQPMLPVNDIQQKIINTCEEYKGCEHSCLHQAIGIFRSLYQDQVATGTHIGHLSVGNQRNRLYLPKKSVEQMIVITGLKEN